MQKSTASLLALLLVSTYCESAHTLPEDVFSSLPTAFSTSSDRDDDDDPYHDHYYKFLDGVSALTVFDSDDHISTNSTAFGYSNIPNSIPMSTKSHFPIGSNSKLYTTVAIYQLAEQGKLDVTADISSMLDSQDFENFGWGRHRTRKLCPRLSYGWYCQKITLEHLLSMSSGIYPELNCQVPTSTSQQCNPYAYIISSGSIGLTVGTFLNQPLTFKPGTQYHYSNPNFILATYFVEKYSGMTFRDYLQTNILDKIGLNATYFDFFNKGLHLDPYRVGQYVKYYDETTEKLISVGADIVQLDLGIASGTGGILSTVHDQATFWRALF